MASTSSIELKILSGEGLKVFNYFQKPVVFVQVSIATDDPDHKLDQHQKQTQRTTTVREDHGHPEWNQEMRFDLSDLEIGVEHLFLQFDLRHEGLVFGDKPIGEIRVPLTDLVEGSNGIVRFVSYEVRTPDGKPNGALNFSYKVASKGRSAGDQVVSREVRFSESRIPYPASIAAGDQVVSREVQFSVSSPPIGKIRVPLTDLIDGSDGKPNGALNFSYKVNSMGRDLGAENPEKEHYSPPVPNPARIAAGDQVVSREVQFSEPPIPNPASIAAGDQVVSREVQFSESFPSQLGHDVYYSPPNGYYGPPPPAAIHHHHHHHHGPPPPGRLVGPWAGDPRSYSGGYDYRVRRWGPGSVQWGSWNGR